MRCLGREFTIGNLPDRTNSHPVLGDPIGWCHRADMLATNIKGDPDLVAPMTLRIYSIVLAGLINSLLVMYAITTPIIPTDTGMWYESVPRYRREPLDPELGVLLPSTTTLYCAAGGPWWAFEFWRPTPSQLSQLEEDLSHFLPHVDSLVRYRYWGDHVSFRAYHRQYVGLQGFGEQRVIAVNGFLDLESERHPNWRRNMACMDDGGTNYWHVQYDPVARRFRGFGFNGTA